MKRVLYILIFLSSPAWGQLPQTRIYLFDMQKMNKSYSLQNPKLVSKKEGYNNQPYFSQDGETLYFTSSLDSTNTELYKINLTKKKWKPIRITKTKEAEYSPKLTPDMDKLSCVRVEMDKTTQHLVTYSLKGKTPQILLPGLKSIGYYEWLSSFEFIAFELPEPFYFVKHSILTPKSDTIATHIGRTFNYNRPKNRLVYVDKSDSLHWKIKWLDMSPAKLKQKNPPQVLTETLEGEEDFCILMDGSILMGHAGKLYIKKNPFKFTNSTWEMLADLSTYGIKKFFRIAVTYDNTKFALVASD